MNATSALAGALDAADTAANGPRGFPDNRDQIDWDQDDWNQIDWNRVEAEVRRLRQRIFTASKAGEHRKVRSLQRLMLRSRANALLSVRRVAQDNQGKRTAGVDGRTALLASQRVELARWVQQRGHGFAPFR